MAEAQKQVTFGKTCPCGWVLFPPAGPRPCVHEPTYHKDTGDFTGIAYDCRLKFHFIDIKKRLCQRTL